MAGFTATPPPIATMAQTESDMVEACGRFAQSLGMARSVGEIYGLLYLSPESMNFEDIASALSLSKASVSTGTRQLMSLGCIRKVWRRDERKDYFEAEQEIGILVRRAYENVFKTRLQNAEEHLSDMLASLESDKAKYDPAEFRLKQQRLKKLLKIQSRIRKVLPFVEKIL
jgi:DNA-binding transcriptional regulator GbsR (MarR family)